MMQARARALNEFQLFAAALELFFFCFFFNWSDGDADGDFIGGLVDTSI